MFYTVYKTTNLLDNKIYIGKHQTKDLNDSYFGSGKHLKRAIKKYGRENFKKEIVELLDSEESMNRLEALLVTEEFCARDDTYNMCSGGQGGFSYINSFDDSSVKLTLDRERQKRISPMNDPQFRNKFSDDRKRGQIKSYEKYQSLSKLEKALWHKKWSFGGLRHSPETIQKMKQSAIGKHDGNKNSSFGTMWITNGIENKKIKKDLTPIPEGWYKGRMNGE